MTGLSLALSLGSGRRIPTPWSIMGANLAVFHDLQSPANVFKDEMGTPAAVGDPVYMVADVASWQGKAMEAVLAEASDLKSTGAVTVIGAPSAGSYNTSSGQFLLPRGDVNNYNYLNFGGLVNGAIYAITLTNTGTTSFGVRTNFNATSIRSVLSGQTKTVYASPANGGLTVISETNGQPAIGTITAIKLLPGCHMAQLTAANRPILRQNATTGARYLETDGVDDGMLTRALDLSAKSRLGLFTAYRKLSDVAGAILIEHGRGGVDASAWSLQSPRSAAIFRPALQIRTSTTDVAGKQGENTAAPVTQVVSGAADYAGATLADKVQFRTNGVVGTVTESAGAAVTGTFGNWPLSYFQRQGGTSPFTGHYYGDMILTETPTAAQIAWAESYYNRLAAAF